MKNIQQKYNVKNDTFNTVEIINVPESLQELQAIANDNDIVKIVVNQVIYHTILTRARKALQDGKPFESIDFKTGFEKQERASSEKTQALKQLKNLSVEQLQKLLASLQ